jgi:hypothetical protein
MNYKLCYEIYNALRQLETKWGGDQFSSRPWGLTLQQLKQISSHYPEEIKEMIKRMTNLMDALHRATFQAASAFPYLAMCEEVNEDLKEILKAVSLEEWPALLSNVKTEDAQVISSHLREIEEEKGPTLSELYESNRRPAKIIHKTD